MRARPRQAVKTFSGGAKARRTTTPAGNETTTATAIFQSSPIRKSYQNRPKARTNRSAGLSSVASVVGGFGLAVVRLGSAGAASNRGDHEPAHGEPRQDQG